MIVSLFLDLSVHDEIGLDNNNMQDLTKFHLIAAFQLKKPRDFVFMRLSKIPEAAHYGEVMSVGEYECMSMSVYVGVCSRLVFSVIMAMNCYLKGEPITVFFPLEFCVRDPESIFRNFTFFLEICTVDHSDGLNHLKKSC